MGTVYIFVPLRDARRVMGGETIYTVPVFLPAEPPPRKAAPNRAAAAGAAYWQGRREGAVSAAMKRIGMDRGRKAGGGKGIGLRAWAATAAAFVWSSAAQAQDFARRPGRIERDRPRGAMAAGHLAGHDRHGGRGDRGRLGRLPDADRADQLALRRDRDPRLLHPVRRRQHRRGDPVDGRLAIKGRKP